MQKAEKDHRIVTEYITEKIEKTIESEETKAQDEANRNQRIREILEEFMA